MSERTSQAATVISYRYRFEFDNGDTREFLTQLDESSLALVEERPDSLPEPLPEWTELDCEKCPNCPLESTKVEHCPAALALVDLISFFREHPSTEPARIEIESAQRRYSKRTSVQYGISGLMGLRMAASGCPILAKLRRSRHPHVGIRVVKGLHQARHGNFSGHADVMHDGQCCTTDIVVFVTYHLQQGRFRGPPGVSHAGQ